MLVKRPIHSRHKSDNGWGRTLTLTAIKLREKYSFHRVSYGWRGMPGRALRALDAERPSGIPTQSVGTSPLNLMAVTLTLPHPSLPILIVC